MHLISVGVWLLLCALAAFDDAYICAAQSFETPTTSSQITTFSPQELEQLIDEIFGTDTRNSSSDSPSCICTPMNMCKKYNNSTINTNGEGIIDIRIDQCRPNSLEICCDEVKSQDPKPPPPARPNVKKNSCGYRNENGVGFRITAGNSEAQFGEFPWMVALLAKKYNDQVEIFQYTCGGSLIHPGVVLTAAHCVHSYAQKAEELLVRAGEWDSKSNDEIIPYQQRTAEKIIVHKSFTSGPLYNDIALVFLKKDFELIENVGLVCLPTQNENVDTKKCVACGWGKENFESEIYQNILKKVDLPMVPRAQCHRALTTTRLGPRFKLHQSFLCAGGIAGVDTCTGDGGGPLMCPISGNPDHYQQVGIVAWGIGCGNSIPGVYVNIPHFRNWIDEKFKENGFSTAGYTYANKSSNQPNSYPYTTT